MKKYLAGFLLLCACGNWSNSDLEYVYALPQRDTLKSQLGAQSAMQGVRRDPLLGEHSDVYESTKKASDEFNAFLDGVLTGLDTLRTIPPTKREDNKRIWGPYQDQKNPGFEVKVEVVKVEDKRFQWSLQMGKRFANDFVVVGGGKFVPTESLRKGRGDFFFDAVTAHALLGTTKKAGDPDKIDVGYSTDTDPVIVEVDFTVGTTTTVGYDYNRYADSSAAFTYTVGGLPDPDATKISAVAAWDAKTAGDVVYNVLEGNNRGAMARQCWDADQKIVHELLMLPDGGVYQTGSATNCATVPTLQPLPPFP